jgi:class 3 adenylate cyclase
VTAAVLLAVPLAGLVVLLAAPGADITWEHHPSHFWLVVATAAVSFALAWSTADVARRRGDARLSLVSCAFLVAAGFLALHALATPKVLLDAPNQGFTVATPVGLVLASLLCAASAAPLDRERAAWVVRRTPALRAGLLALLGLWAVVSLAELPPLDDPTPLERAHGALVVAAALALVAYGYAAVRYLTLARRSPSPVLLAVVAAFVLLAEATVAVALARNWHASWWLWHLLMLLAFAAIAWAVRREPPAERFSDLYLDDTSCGVREVSVLFADLEGFTSYSDARDPREVSAMLNARFGAVVPALRGAGAEIDRLMGDAVLATFNTRGDQPDHAVRAAGAALSVQRAAGAVDAEHPDWPRFRVGVNTGEAVVGVLGAGEGRSYTVVGDTVNVAARLEAAAPVGGVVVGAATLERLGPAAGASPLGSLAVKGKREPVAAYRLSSLDARQGAGEES